MALPGTYDVPPGEFSIEKSKPAPDGELVMTCAILSVRVVASPGPSGFLCWVGMQRRIEMETLPCHSFETDMWCPHIGDFWVGYSPRF
jgi:hypothetical protein